MTVSYSVTNIGKDAFKNCFKLENILIGNPECKIYDAASTISNGIDESGNYYFNGTIWGYSNSTVLDYSEKYFYGFSSLGVSVVTYEDLTCEIHIDYIEITDCDENAEKVVIPDKIENLPVRKIGSGAFSDCKNLTSITIPNSITYIGGGFSDGCTALTEINVNEKNTVYYSYDSALYKYAYKETDNKKYNTLLVYPQGKQGEYTIKDGTEKIGGYAFEGCSGLTAVNIPESVTSICYKAFADCTGLKSIDIPASVTYIGYFFSISCPALEEINVDAENTVYFSRDGVLYKNIEYYGYNYDTDSFGLIGEYKKILVYPEGKKGDYTIEDGTEIIGDMAFENCANLESVTIPESVTSIWFIGFMKSVINNGFEIKVNGNGYTYRDYYFNGIIYGYENSTAQKYANNCGYKFVAINSSPAPTEYKQGDINGDNMIDAVDSSLILQEYALLSTEGSGNFTDIQKSSADINGDGMTDTVDASLVLQYYAYVSTNGKESPEEFFRVCSH